MPNGEETMGWVYGIAILVVCVFLGAIAWYMMGDDDIVVVGGLGRMPGEMLMDTAVMGPPTAPYIPPPPPPPTYMFHQGKDSPGNDIKRMASLANQIQDLQDTCDSLPGCKGFNTNAWMKKTIRPESQWRIWTSDPNKGMYVKQ